MFYLLSKTLDALLAPLTWTLILGVVALFWSRRRPRAALACGILSLLVLCLFSIDPVANGLWRMLESAFAQLQTLHAAGLAHGDAELHNFIVCPSPLEIVMIDFEVALRRDAAAPDVWAATCAKDLVPIAREAVLLQCALGPQPGALAQFALAHIDRSFKDPDRFRRELGHPPDVRS